MPKTREELLKLLEGVEGGADYLACFNGIEESFKGEITKRNNENKNLRERMKDAEAKSKTAAEKYEKVAEFLGVDPEDEEVDLDATIAELGKNAKGGADLAKRLEAANARIKKMESEHKQALGAEVAKRHDAMKKQEIIKALTEAGAADPAAIMEIFSSKIEIGEDDSMTAKNEKGESVAVAAYAKGWLAAHPWAAKNPQAGGGGSGAGGNAGGTGAAGEFGKSLAEAVKTNNGAAAADNPYFK